MKVEIEQLPAELRRDGRRVALLAVAGALASLATGGGLVALADHLAGRFCT